MQCLGLFVREVAETQGVAGPIDGDGDDGEGVGDDEKGEEGGHQARQIIKGSCQARFSPPSCPSLSHLPPLSLLAEAGGGWWRWGAAAAVAAAATSCMIPAVIPLGCTREA